MSSRGLKRKINLVLFLGRLQLFRNLQRQTVRPAERKIKTASSGGRQAAGPGGRAHGEGR